MRIGKASIIDATKTALEKYGSNIHLSDHINEMLSRAQIQNIGKSGIGTVASHATKTTIRLNAVHSYIDRLRNATEISGDLKNDLKALNLFPQLDFANPTATMNHFHNILDTYQQSASDAFGRIERILRDPEQHLISTKKQLNPKAGEMMFSLIENIQHIHEDRHKSIREFWGLNFTDTQLSHLREGNALHRVLMKRDPLYNQDVTSKLSQTSSVGIGASSLEFYTADHFLKTYIGQLGAGSIDYLASVANDKLKSGFADKSSQAWRTSVKQLLYSNPSKSLLGMGIGLALMTVANPNPMTGSTLDFGMDLGHRPGFDSKSDGGLESLDAEPGNTLFSKKWTYLLKKDPILKDNMDELSDKRYKDLNMNTRNFQEFNPTKKYKRNYIDYRKDYNSRYVSNDMRRAQIPAANYGTN